MSATIARAGADVASLHRPRAGRRLIVLALLAGAVAGVAVGLQAAPATDLELLRLLRAMAVLKLAFIAAAAGSILWRLQAPVGPAWLAAYAATCAAMAAGPGLIWFGSQIILASILLHAGVAGALVLLWRDAATSELLRMAVARRTALRRE